MSDLTEEEKEQVREYREEAERKLAEQGMNPLWAKVISFLLASLLAGIVGWLSACSSMMPQDFPDGEGFLWSHMKEIATEVA